MTSYNMKRKGRIIPRDRELQYIVYLKSLFYNYEYEFIYHYTKVYQRKEENFDKWLVQAYMNAIDFIGHQDSNSGYRPWKVHPHTILFCIHRQSYPPKDKFEEFLQESCLYLYHITQWIIELVPRYIRPKSRYPFPLDKQKLINLKESLLLIDKVVIQLSPEVIQNKEGGGKTTFFYNQKFQVNEDEYIKQIKKPILQFMKIQKRDDNFIYTEDKIKCALYVCQDQLKRPEFRDNVLNYYSLQGLQFITRKVMIKFVQKENANIINQFPIKSIPNPIEVTARFEKIINLLTSSDGQQFYYCLQFLVLFIYDMMDEFKDQQYIHPDKWVSLMGYLYHESFKNSKFPKWTTINCQAQILCNGDYFMPIKIELWHSKQNGQPIIQGKTSVSLNQLKNRPMELKLRDIQDQARIVGKLLIQLIVPIIPYIIAGLQLNLVVAIDFTASNKNINDISSLHYQNPNGTPTRYEQAILSVGDILINYDYDKKVPVYGFGCKPKLNKINTNETLHCFPLNDNPDDPEVYGLQGIVQVYRDSVRRLVFDGPTYLHPVLQEVMKQAQNIKDNQQDNYLILLILTDGQTNDLQITIDDVIASSHLPLSIILIGIGNADFRNMEVLDNDDLSMVDSNGRKSQRDLVQFVPFNKYNGDAALLSREVLQELPNQVVEYMKLRNQDIKPKQELQQFLIQAAQQTQLQCHYQDN